MLVDHRLVKLGKAPAKKAPRRLKLGKYLTAELPPAPDSCRNSRGITEWGMFLNDSLGCCTIAAGGHAYQGLVLSQISPGVKPGIIMPSDDTILRYYEDWDGYDPQDPSTDQGGEETDVLNKWRKNGFSGRSLQAYADPDPTNIEHVKQAIYLLGGLYIGVALPTGWQNKPLWDANMGEAGSWGGHAVWVPDYDEDGPSCITWGEMQRFTWDGFTQYVDEVHGLIVPEWKPPAGFDKAALVADLQEIVG